MYGLSQDSEIARATAGGESESSSRKELMKGSFHRVLPAAEGAMLLPFSKTTFERVDFEHAPGCAILGSSSFPAAMCIGMSAVLFEQGVPSAAGSGEEIRRGLHPSETGSPPSDLLASSTRLSHSAPSLTYPENPTEGDRGFAERPAVGESCPLAILLLHTALGPSVCHQLALPR